MKRYVIPAVLIAAAGAALYTKDLWLPPPPGQTNYLGYVEGETVLVGAPAAGRLVVAPPAKGATVTAGEVLFGLDPAILATEVAKARTAIVTAQAQLDNLLTGKREEELLSLRAQRQEAEANLVYARVELQRARQLADTGAAARQRLDQAEAQVGQWQARVDQYAALEAAAELPARQKEIEAARSRVGEAEAAQATAEARLAELSVKSPADAQVADTFFEAGEWVQSGQPVLSLQPPGAIMLRFFVPETAVAAARPGATIRFSCDGCAAGLTATITHVATEPEYTPPVIYSQGARAKLVFLVEARPESAAALRPGLPIEVEPLP